MDFSVGDRVIYISGAHGDHKSNPLWGGREGYVIGTIDFRDIHVHYITVKWDNGRHNSYNDEDLNFAPKAKDNPNLAFRMKGAKNRGLSN